MTAAKRQAKPKPKPKPAPVALARDAKHGRYVSRPEPVTETVKLEPALEAAEIAVPVAPEPETQPEPQTPIEPVEDTPDVPNVVETQDAPETDLDAFTSSLVAESPRHAKPKPKPATEGDASATPTNTAKVKSPSRTKSNTLVAGAVIALGAAVAFVLTRGSSATARPSAPASVIPNATPPRTPVRDPMGGWFS
jgi:hypothetical protein